MFFGASAGYRSQIDESLFDVFVDSVNGSDANAGTSEALPLLTLAAAQSAAASFGNGARVGLAKGSSWTAQELIVGTSGAGLSESTIGTYGTGNPPEVDLKATYASWTLNSGSVYVTEWGPQSKVTGASYPSTIRVFEDGLELTPRNSIALCEANPGSFYANTTVNPVLLYLHPTGSGDPNANGKVYKSSRYWSVSAILGESAQSHTISGVVARDPLQNDGGIVAGIDSLIKECVVSGGNKHHFYIGSGEFRDCIALVDSPQYAGASPFVYFNTIGGKPILHTRCYVAAGSNDTGFFGHGSTFSSIAIDQCHTLGLAFPVVSYQGATLTNNYWRNSLNWLGTTGTTTITRDLFRSNVATGTGGGPDGTLTLTDCAAYSSANYFIRRFVNATTLTIQNCSIKVGGDHVANDSSRVVGLTFNNCVLSKTLNSYWTGFGSNLSVGGDYTVFLMEVFNTFKAYHLAVLYSSLSAFQAATGAFANSVYAQSTDQARGNSNAFWLGVANDENDGPADGDFRINPTARVYNAAGSPLIGVFADGTTPLTDAGPQTHWDYNTRTVESGPPTQWPTMPIASESDAKSYISDPEAWNYYV